MIKMKDSGIPWIGQVPENWEVAKYKFFATSGMGETILGGNLVEDGIPVYSATQNNTVFGYVKSSSLRLNKNDFVIPARGNSIGCVTIVKDNEATATQTTIYSKLNDKINYKFLYYCCVGLKDVWFYFEDTAIPQITVNQVQNNKVPLPPKEIQQKIVEILDKKCGQIDELIKVEENEIEKLKEYKTSLITKVVTKGLDSNAKMKDSGIPWIGQIPEDWKVVKIKKMFSTSKGLSITKENLKEEGIKVISYGQIHSKDNKFTKIDEKLYRYVDKKYLESDYNCLVKYSDFIFADTSEDLEGTGNYVYIDKDDKIFAGYHTIILKNKTTNNLKYYSYFFNSQNFRYQLRANVSGVKLYSITQKIISSTDVIEPNIKVQQQIVEYLDKGVKKLII